MKSLVDLLVDLLLDCGRRSAAPVRRDVLTLRTRVKNEGDSFITITLPAYCQDFERSLADGRIAPGSFRFFNRDDWEVPRFLSGFLCNVFDSRGVLLANPSVDCIRSVRQICLFGKKILRPCSQERARVAADSFVKRDSEVVLSTSGQLSRWFDAVSRVLIRGLRLDDEVRKGFMSTHGPGATEERVLDNQKWKFKRWHKRLERVGFTYAKNGVASANWFIELVESEHWPHFVRFRDEKTR